MKEALKIIYIEWVDSTSYGGVWKPRDDVEHLQENPVIVSVGVLLRETPQSITVVGHIGSGQVSGEMCIPKVAIKKRRWLSVRGK